MGNYCTSASPGGETNRNHILVASDTSPYANSSTSNNDKNSVFTEQYNHFFKLLLLGDSGVGKSSLLMRLTDNRFSEAHISTVGVDFRSTDLTIDNKHVNLQIWDTAGQERYRSITTAYYRGAHGVMLVFDLTSRETYHNIHKWLADVQRHAHDKTQIILIGNKKDLNALRCITSEEAQQLAEELGLPYFELSAKQEFATEVHGAFEEVTKRILRNDQE